jgi:hypothetical protein
MCHLQLSASSENSVPLCFLLLLPGMCCGILYVPGMCCGTLTFLGCAVVHLRSWDVLRYTYVCGMCCGILTFLGCAAVNLHSWDVLWYTYVPGMCCGTLTFLACAAVYLHSWDVLRYTLVHTYSCSWESWRHRQHTALTCSLLNTSHSPELVRQLDYLTTYNFFVNCSIIRSLFTPLLPLLPSRTFDTIITNGWVQVLKIYIVTDSRKISSTSHPNNGKKETEITWDDD